MTIWELFYDIVLVLQDLLLFYSLTKLFLAVLIDPPGHCRIGGHYFHAWHPSVTKEVWKQNTRYNGRHA